MWFLKWFSKQDSQDNIMKYLICGLGNMGADYDHTRHNIGFDVVDYLAHQNNAKWKHETLGDIAQIKHKGRSIILLKPSTFMNRSGKAVNYWMQKEKIPKERVLIIVDDLNIDFGKIRIRGKGSDGGHNGLKDINQTIGNQYARLRIGIGNSFGKGRQVNFVLGKWTNAEKEQLQEIISTSGEASLSFASIGVQHTMSQFNR